MTTYNENGHATGYAHRPADSPAYWNFGTYWRLLASSDDTGGRSATFDELFPKGPVAPPHVHDREEEAFFVLEGDLVFTIGDDDAELLAPPGDDVTATTLEPYSGASRTRPTFGRGHRCDLADAPSRGGPGRLGSSRRSRLQDGVGCPPGCQPQNTVSCSARALPCS